MENLQTNSSTTDCGCKKEISETAKAVLRLDYNKVPAESQQLIADLKYNLAQLYTKIENLSVEPLESLSALQRQESFYEAKRHLQLASYYITHALTA